MYLEKLIRDKCHNKYGMNLKPYQILAILEEADKILGFASMIDNLASEVILQGLEASVLKVPAKRKGKASKPSTKATEANLQPPRNP